MSKIVVRFMSLLLLVVLLASGSLPAGSAPLPPDSLARDALGPLSLTRDAGSGALTFLRSSDGVLSGVDKATLAANPFAAAVAFLARHEAALGMPRVAQQVVLDQVKTDDLGMTHVRLSQVLNGVPVYGAGLIVHYAADAATVRALNGHFLPRLAVDTTPTIGAARALAVASSIQPQATPWEKPQLHIYSGQIDPAVSGTHLVWLVRLADAQAPSRLLYVIDAHSGAVLTTYNEIDTARNRQVYDTHHTQSLPGTLVRSEGAPATGDADADHAYQYLGDTYDYYFSKFGRDSYDNAGAAMKATVHYGSNYQNAYWDGNQMVFGDGFPIDDVTAHEMTHAVTEHEANLIYQNQSGALNESFSDIFGEIIDQTNGAGNDTPPVAWLMGEDLPGIGAIRNMADPPQFGDPDKVSSYSCTASDNGGVHTNSGIPNKAAYLIAAGGSFNGQTISGLGLDKMGRVEYRALSQYLTASATFLDDYNALNQSCSDLIGTYGITAADCTQVDNALRAVEMNTAPACTGGGCLVQQTVADKTAFDSAAEAIQTTIVLYRTREQVLRGTPAGEHYIDMYYRYTPQMARLLSADAALRRHLVGFLREVTPGLDALAGHNDKAAAGLTVSPAAVSHLDALLRGFELAAPGSDLAQAIRSQRKTLDLQGLAGKSFAAAWEQINGQVQ